MSSTRINVRFVGLSEQGWASTMLAPAMLKLADKYALKAVSTRSLESAQASAAKQAGLTGAAIKAYHGDTAHIAHDPDVDLIAVSVKAPDHKMAALPVIEAGKDLFIEWSAGATVEETTELANAARVKGVRTMVGLQGRQMPVIKKIKEIIDSGTIGKILSTNIVSLVPRKLKYWGPRVEEGRSYITTVSSGASMLDLAVGHQMDCMQYVLGDFASISASTSIMYPTITLVDAEDNPTGRTLQAETPDHIVCSATLKSSALVSIIWRGGQTFSPGRRQFLWEIDGEKGCIRLKGGKLVSSTLLNADSPKVYLNGELMEIPGTAEGPMGGLTSAWAEFAKGSAGQYPTLDDAVKIRRLLDAISRSAKEGRRIELE
ncbi:NAD-binding Rossmann fold oxidoreductase [Infundibulicybe gibba]|nr:NAD-binding Rossmann fold oxidoreductase [Infundibulicybe gibba]